MASDNPHFHEQEGQFAVDYRSHDGLVGLGSGDWTFWTRWSAAGQGSIHVYSDAGTAVAVARDIYEIGGVTPQVFDAADFTSRTRTPHAGEIVLLQNPGGYVAAVQILNAVVARESKEGSVLEARYRILTDKSRDFSKGSLPEVVALESAISAALRSFNALKDVPDPDESAPWIGHNNPPEADRLLKEDFEALAQELRETLKQPQDEGRLKQLGDMLAWAVKRIGAGLARRYGWFAEGYYQKLGDLAATVAVGLGGWAAFHGDLDQVGKAVSALTKTLFGWP